MIKKNMKLSQVVVDKLYLCKKKNINNNNTIFNMK